eukprot:420245-Prorocentrum_minimum.AAC.1
MWLEVTVSKDTEVVNSLGHALIEYVELEIGGQRIDKHYGEWLDIWSELTLPEDELIGMPFELSKERADAWIGTTRTPFNEQDQNAQQ